MLLFVPGALWAQPGSSGLDSMSLDDLMKQRAALHSDSATASGISESLRDAPAAMVVLDREEIRKRAYDGMDELLFALPGFDVIRTGGTMETIAYQRGYRTPWTQRTLLLVDGKVDNNLWNHAAQLSRQYPMNLVEKVEVLYGPAGVVYGPNAFLGVINIVTRDASRLADGESYAEASVLAGDFDSEGIDLALGGRWGDFSCDLGVKLFRSDEAALEDYADWGYSEERWLRDPATWGAGIGQGVDPVTGKLSPVGDLDVDGTLEPSELSRGAPLGAYADPSKNYGVMGTLRWAGTSLGMIRWKTDEGYGPYYSFADAQPNSLWTHESLQLFLERDDRAFDGRVGVDSALVYRESRVGGEDWAESFGNYVSLSAWNSFSKAWRFEQRYDLSLGSEWNFSGGLKYERKELSKLYLLDNYWDGAGVNPFEGPTSSNGHSSDGSGVLFAGDISSLEPTRRGTPFPRSLVPDINLSKTDDIGVFGQAIWDRGDWRANVGLRYDENSEYGSVLDPRASIIYHYRPGVSFKLLYGEAFQEPSPKDLYGGWNGRLSNPDLEPEKAANLELVTILQGEHWLHDFSIFHASYRDAIAGAENVGAREVYGFEYRGQVRFANPLPGSSDVTASVNYSYTDARAERQFNNATGVWDSVWDDLGDIAPHKVQIDLNLPCGRRWNFNVFGSWVSERDLFSQNPLRADSNPERAQNRRAESYMRVDFAALYRRESYEISLKIENLFEESYLVPGAEGASSGDNFEVDADGFQNSLIPQVKTRRAALRMTYRF